MHVFLYKIQDFIVINEVQLEEYEYEYFIGSDWYRIWASVILLNWNVFLFGYLVYLSLDILYMRQVFPPGTLVFSLSSKNSVLQADRHLEIVHSV